MAWAAGTLLSSALFELIHHGGRSFWHYQLPVRSGDQMLSLIPLLTGAGFIAISQLLRRGWTTAAAAVCLNAGLALAFWPHWGPRRHGPELVVLAMHGTLLLAWLRRERLPSASAFVSSLLANVVLQAVAAALLTRVEPSTFLENFGELTPWVLGPVAAVSLYVEPPRPVSHLRMVGELMWAGLLLFVLQAGILRYFGGSVASALPVGLFLGCALAAHPCSGLDPAARRRAGQICLIGLLAVAGVATWAALGPDAGRKADLLLTVPAVIAGGGALSGVLLYLAWLLARPLQRWLTQLAEPRPHAMAASSAPDSA